jgi:hypothetical protein
LTGVVGSLVCQPCRRRRKGLMQARSASEGSHIVSGMRRGQVRSVDIPPSTPNT